MGVARTVVDLYAGAGTFALRLAETANVHAVEGIAAPLEALRAAHARTPGLRPVTTQVRDLARQPLAPDEFARFGGVVLDPPFAGALPQVQALARLSPGGGPDRLAYVSCNPATLARDLRVLVDGGWRIVRIVPIDAFVWSAHVEVVAALAR
jgi:23S rRNA (uracil1939-C5)-methyltransferase